MPVPQDTKVHTIPDFSAGIVQDRAPWNIPDNAVADGRNVTFLGGKVQKRWGFRTYRGNIPGRAQRVFRYIVPSSGAHQLLALSTTGFYKYDSATNTWTSIHALAGNPDILPILGVTSTRLYLANGVDQHRSYNGTLQDADPDWPYTWRYGSLIAGAESTYAIVAYASTGTATTSAISGLRLVWGIIEAAVAPTSRDLPDTETFITGIVNFSGYTLVFTERSIWFAILAGNNLRLEQRVSGAGCIAPGSIQVTPVGVLYLGPDSIYLFNGVQSQVVGRNLQPWMRRINMAKANRIVSFVDPIMGEYWLFAPVDGATDANVAFVLNYFTGYTSVHYPLPGSVVGTGLIPLHTSARGIAADTLCPAFTVYDPAANTSALYEISNDVGDGSPPTGIDAWFDTKMLDFGVPGMKRLYTVVLFMDRPATGTLELRVGTSDDGVTVTWSNPYSVQMAGSERVTVSVDDVKPAVRYQLRVRNAEANVDFGIKAVQFWWKERGMY